MKRIILSYFKFISNFISDRSMILRMAKNDFQAKFASSFLGGAWAFVQPLVNLLVMWFVFECGFRNPPISGVPFIMWLCPAYLSWSFFCDSLLSSTNCLLEYSYLVKKVNFNVSILPVIKILSNSFVHFGFILFIFVMAAIHRIPFSIYNIQVIYYYLCTILLLSGLCFFLSSVSPFAKDIVNIVGIIVTIGFWVTPIFWSPQNLNSSLQFIISLNPMYYVTQGYRDAFIFKIWFWEHGTQTFIFWLEAFFFHFLGIYSFKKLRPQFADVL